MKWECFLFRWEWRLENDCESNCLIRCIFPLMSIHEPERENTSFSCSPLTLLWRLCLTLNHFPKVELSMRRRWDVFAGPADSEDTLAQVAARAWSSTHYWRFAGPIRPAACFCAFRIFVFSRILKAIEEGSHVSHVGHVGHVSIQIKSDWDKVCSTDSGQQTQDVTQPIQTAISVPALSRAVSIMPSYFSSI